jgi:predicted esterase
MRVVYSLILLAVGFSAGAAVAQYVVQRHPSAPAAPPPPAAAAPAAPEGARDPAADLQGQMMWDPNSRTYQAD